MHIKHRKFSKLQLSELICTLVYLLKAKRNFSFFSLLFVTSNCEKRGQSLIVQKRQIELYSCGCNLSSFFVCLFLNRLIELLKTSLKSYFILASKFSILIGLNYVLLRIGGVK